MVEYSTPVSIGSYRPFTIEWFINHPEKSIFVNGVAGCGKSFFIRHLKDTAINKLICCAPTGVSACSISCKTIHSMFNIPPLDRFVLYKAIMGINSYGKSKLMDASVILFDECYMITDSLISKVFSILKKMNIFDNLKFIFVGDRLQLPAIGNLLTINEDIAASNVHYELPFVGDIVPGRNFKERCDIEYKDILENFRSEYSTNEQLYRIIKSLIPQMSQTPFCEALTVAYKNSTVAEINKEGSEIVEELPLNLYIYKKNSPAMITSNIDIAKKLFNGKFVKVVDAYMIINKEGQPKRISLMKEYYDANKDDEEYATYLKRSFLAKKHNILVDVDGDHIEVPQESLVPAYAITIHKVQSLTLPNINIIFNEQDIMCCKDARALLYVALSRVRNITDVYFNLN